ncbi:MAG: transposase, partial [Mediterranea sp.]|nr:transposase [Mediterranea sp.]
YYLKVSSPAKALSESSMNNLFLSRFEEGLHSISSSINRKGGTKKYDKVCERIGRLKEKYPSVNRMFNIKIEKNVKEICSSITWTINQEVAQAREEELGIYFLQTNLAEAEEERIWIIYNCIRNIESSFRCLKTDLDLRPVYHKTDEATEAHLHLGLLAYWVVNMIRHRLKAKGINSSWTEIKRIMSTQKCVTTTVENDREQTINIRRCSEPTPKVKLIYDAMGYKYAPFIRKKSVVPKTDVNEKESVANQSNTG